MLIEAMQKIDGDGVSMLDCHADLEIFRIRLGKALDFEYHEDNIGALFSIRGPRDASALLDCEVCPFPWKVWARVADLR